MMTVPAQGNDGENMYWKRPTTPYRFSGATDRSELTAERVRRAQPLSSLTHHPSHLSAALIIYMDLIDDQ